jgi:hypothetical protein
MNFGGDYFKNLSTSRSKKVTIVFFFVFVSLSMLFQNFTQPTSNCTTPSDTSKIIKTKIIIYKEFQNETPTDAEIEIQARTVCAKMAGNSAAVRPEVIDKTTVVKSRQSIAGEPLWSHTYNLTCSPMSCNAKVQKIPEGRKFDANFISFILAKKPTQNTNLNTFNRQLALFQFGANLKRVQFFRDEKCSLQIQTVQNPKGYLWINLGYGLQPIYAQALMGNGSLSNCLFLFKQGAFSAFDLSRVIPAGNLKTETHTVRGGATLNSNENIDQLLSQGWGSLQTRFRNSLETPDAEIGFYADETCDEKSRIRASSKSYLKFSFEGIRLGPVFVPTNVFAKVQQPFYFSTCLPLAEVRPFSTLAPKLALKANQNLPDINRMGSVVEFVLEPFKENIRQVQFFRHSCQPDSAAFTIDSTGRVLNNPNAIPTPRISPSPSSFGMGEMPPSVSKLSDGRIKVRWHSQTNFAFDLVNLATSFTGRTSQCNHLYSIPNADGSGIADSSATFIRSLSFDPSSRGRSVHIILDRKNAFPYRVFRREFREYNWKLIGVIAPNQTEFVDFFAQEGGRFDYQLRADKMEYFDTKPNFYIIDGMASFNADVFEEGKTFLLVIEEGMRSKIADSLEAYKQALREDGYRVVEVEAPRHLETGGYGTNWNWSLSQVNTIKNKEAVAKTKQTIKDIYIKEKGSLAAVLLIGHVAVPYTGFDMPDGHAENRGAWPADSYYTDMSGSWPDIIDRYTPAEIAVMNWQNINTSNDGKFDVDTFPGKMEFVIGRIDFSNLNYEREGTSEAELVRRYFVKNIAYRKARLTTQYRAIFAEERSFPPGHNRGRITLNRFFNENESASVLFPRYSATSDSPIYNVPEYMANKTTTWLSARGFGSMDHSEGIIESSQFKAGLGKNVIFWNLYGSYFGNMFLASGGSAPDKLYDDLLRMPIASSSPDPVSSKEWGLVSVWGQMWLNQRMVLGDSIGQAQKLSLESWRDYLSPVPFDPAYNILGDPTLKLYVADPILDLKKSKMAVGVVNGIKSFELTWKPSNNPDIIGYHVYEALTPEGHFRRLTSKPIVGSRFFVRSDQRKLYLVRAIQRVNSKFGNFNILGSGAIVE